MNKTEKLLSGAAAVAAGTAAAVTAASVFMTKTAIDREPPKALKAVHHAVAGGVIPEPELEEITQSAERLANADTETVTITSRDGLTLKGHWFPADDPKRIVIAMHGWRSSWYRDFGVPTKYFHETGCSILYPDQRGQDDSAGDYIGFGVLERYDCLDWLNYALRRFGNTLPIYLCGISMGATTVLMAAGLGLPSQVHGILADCGYTTPHAVWAHVMENNLHISEKLYYPIVNRICHLTAHFDGDETSTVEAMQTNRVPVLFIHGADDKFVPVDMTYENYDACIAPKELLIVAGAGHGMSYFADTAAYQGAVEKFFAKYDAQPSPGLDEEDEEEEK